jgi:hypothetical protein
MNSFRKSNILKKVLLIFFFVASIPITFIYLFIKDLSLFNSLFSEYIISGNSFFLPFFSSNTIIFQFSTGHLIDIIIMTNLILFIERLCYQYYMSVCLKNNYLEIYSEPYAPNGKEPKIGSFPNSNLIINLKDYSDTEIFEKSDEYYFYQESRTDATQLSSKGGYYNSMIKVRSNKPNFLHNHHNQHKNNFSMFHKFSTNILNNYHLPSKKISTFSNPYKYYTQKEGF